MTPDDLSAPLGQTPARKPRRTFPLRAAHLIAAALALFLLTFAGFALFGDNPLGGEPSVRIAYDPSTMPSGAGPKAPPSASVPGPAPIVVRPADPPIGQQTVTIIDGKSGARRDVLIPAPGATPDAGAPAGPATGINPKLLENTRHGMAPTIADGLKPFRAYATGNDADRVRAAKGPSIAIVITGLGVGAAKTNDAIVKLPAAVTLAFTPYGSEPGKLVERARAQRHEVLLQLPLEPFDYPDNDPGPQSLLTSLNAEQNLDRMLWHMTRFQGYVGLTSFMGGRFVVSDAAMQPVLREAAKRGLAWLDDGSSPRSVAMGIADSQSLPAARADTNIDAVPTPAEIDRSLAALETLARERGIAIGVASALPVSIERIGAWARGLEEKGIMLVPLTTAMLKPRSS